MKKVKRLLALGAAALMLTSAFAMPASAEERYGWSFNVAPDQITYTTAKQDKNTDSGCYVYYEGGTKPYFTCDILNVAGKSQCKKTGPIHEGEAGRILQYVYENGYDECKLKLTSPTNTYGGGVGTWNPDTTTKVAYINL